MIPWEDMVEGYHPRCASRLFGTRDAHSNWENMYSSELKNVGCKRGGTNLCAYCLPMNTAFLVLGNRTSSSYIAATQSLFQLKVTLVGPRHDQEQELVMLSRRIMWTRRGLTSEADPRHLKEIVKILRF